MADKNTAKIFGAGEGQVGQGQSAAIEIPTDDEIHDYIVAYCRPHAKTEKGVLQRFDHRLHWTARPRFRENHC